MASKIKFEDVKEDIEKSGWTLKSTAYTNLKTDLELICPENHNCFCSYEKWRKGNFECPTCKENQFYKVDNIAVKKSGYRILSFDQASNTTGWSVFDQDKLVKFGTFTTDQKDSIGKIAQTKQWVAAMISKWKPDEVILEDIQIQKGADSENFSFQTSVTTYKTLAHLQGVLANYLFENGILFRVVPPATWRTHSEIKGKMRTDKKKNAQIKVKRFYDVSVSQDEADAILIGKWAAHSHSADKIISF